MSQILKMTELWSSPLTNVIQTVLAIIVIIIFWGSIYAFILAIFQFIFSRWEEAKRKKAWDTIRYMILWIILTIFLLYLFPIAFEKLKIEWYKQYTAQKIFQRSWELIKSLIETTTNTKSNNQYTPKKNYNEEDYSL